MAANARWTGEQGGFLYMVDDDGRCLFKQPVICGYRQSARHCCKAAKACGKTDKSGQKRMNYRHFGYMLLCIGKNRHLMKSWPEKKMKIEDGK